MYEWNLGDILDGIAAVLPPDAPALIHGDRVITQREFTRRTNNLARALIARGAQPGDKVAFYMHNCPEYSEAFAACFKARLIHVNVNYRYTPEEVFYIFDNSDAQTVIFGSELRRHIEAIRHRLVKVKTFIEVGPGGDFAEAYEPLCAEGDGSQLDIRRSPDDMLFLYTGGTTGMPKGVMWGHNDLRQLTLGVMRALGPIPETLDELAESIRATGPGPTSVIGPPLMHGTGLFTAMNSMLGGGAVITLPSLHFDPLEMLEATDRWRASSWTIVGDPFARPLAETLEADPTRFDVTCVERVVSSGVMWSVEVKRTMLKHMPRAVLMDAFSSSEAMGMGSSLMTAAGEAPTAKFAIGERTRVFDENDQPVAPGSGVRGMVAVGPPNPFGYYKDPEKTARTFRVIDGVRYSIPGDWCVVEADGSLTLLGRGNACINTAGEKVFPEEVEEVLKTHPDVEDALVVGLPHPKWGQSVTGVLRLRDGRQLDEPALIAHVRGRLAAYKAPKRIFAGDVALRAPNGKADYKSATAFAAANQAEEAEA
ncbi:MAG TPA: acyl-CoA synthetase [Phenylobacterium sp.]|jgi:fatty-acyl-CoA synthase|uniref:acyl-CoA synthetase n=1 Tax=Phenylobacterium sp. TaxID=1871053 RepID=UPI002D591201|nr:acyl-CoA synthetase [Phenylobacterium sp.]HZZ70344.1 acyl-CoA synthetase [Phenylobacterium sp.]